VRHPMLSLSMIVRDEAERIEAALASVAGFVDEMVVVDTGSEDDTAAIAGRMGASVHHFPWPGDFAPARNRALELVNGDWVLVLDGDERLRPEAQEPLRRLMAEPDALVITLLRRELGAAQAPYSSVSRLFRRHPALRWSRPYHSMIDDSALSLLERQPQWRILHCAEPALLHDGYRTARLADGAKAARLRAAMEADLRRHPGDVYAITKLAGLERHEGRADRARALLEQGLAGCPADAHAERFELLFQLAGLRAGSDPQAAATLYRKALDLPLDPRLSGAARLNLALLHQREGRLEEARSQAQAVVQAAPELATAWVALGLIERQRGDLEAATTAYRAAIQREADHVEAHQNLAAALLLSGDIEGARQGFRTAVSLLHRQGRGMEAETLASRAGRMVKLQA
jgi:tetratricopeptide (TPR) repeat protein